MGEGIYNSEEYVGCKYIDETSSNCCMSLFGLGCIQPIVHPKIIIIMTRSES